MSLKSVKKAWINRRSITLLLTLYYTFATSILLAVITLSLYWAMVGALSKAEHQFLTDEISILQHIVSTKKHDLHAIKYDVSEISYLLDNSVYNYYIRILDENRKTIVQSKGMDHVVQRTSFFDNHIGTNKSYWWQTSDGKSYLLMQSIAEHSSRQWIIQVALDVTYQRNEIMEYRKKLLIALGVGVALAFLLGYAIARRSMRRLHELTDATKKITASSLRQHINPQFWPRELHALGMAFNDMLMRIEKSVMRLTQFSDDLAHELRTPINNLIVETEVMLSKTATVAEYQHVLESNREEMGRISHMIENLLFLARAENPKLELKKILLNVQEEFSVIAEYYQAIAEEKNIRVRCEGEASVFANQVMFRRLLNNLVSNALKYTPSGGEILLSLDENSERARLIFRDTGSGIAAEHLPKIFNRFYRVDMSRSVTSGGIGLGLAIVKSIVDLHRGSIAISSEPGKGTQFEIVFPK